MKKGLLPIQGQCNSPVVVLPQRSTWELGCLMFDLNGVAIKNLFFYLPAKSSLKATIFPDACVKWGISMEIKGWSEFNIRHGKRMYKGCSLEAEVLRTTRNSGEGSAQGSSMGYGFEICGKEAFANIT